MREVRVEALLRRVERADVDAEVVVEDGGLVVRRMRDDDSDYGLMVEWRNRPHVWRWWDPDLPARTLESIKEEYRPDIVPGSPSTVCIIEFEGRPVGFIQFYKWASYGGEATEVGIPFDDRSYGLDIFIGEPDRVGLGIGTRVVRLVSDYFLAEIGASSVALTTDLDNHVAQRCYEKAGFEKVREVLDTDTYKGVRVRCWLMVKAPPNTSARVP